MLMKDFEFIEADLNEEKILQTPKVNINQKIKPQFTMQLLNISQTKRKKHSTFDEIEYTKLKLKPYLSSSVINNKQTKIVIHFKVKLS